MKKVFSALFLSGLAVISYAQSLKSNEDVTSVANAFFDSWNRHDFSDMSDYTTEDFSFVISPGLFWKGRNEVQKNHQNSHMKMMKNTSFTPDKQSIVTRKITPDVSIVNMVAAMGTFYPPDGIDRGDNKAGGNRIIITMVGVKKDGRWLLTAAQGSAIDPRVEAARQQH